MSKQRINLAAKVALVTLVPAAFLASIWTDDWAEWVSTGVVAVFVFAAIGAWTEEGEK